MSKCVDIVYSDLFASEGKFAGSSGMTFSPVGVSWSLGRTRLFMVNQGQFLMNRFSGSPVVPLSGLKRFQKIRAWKSCCRRLA